MLIRIMERKELGKKNKIDVIFQLKSIKEIVLKPYSFLDSKYFELQFSVK